MIWTVFWKDSFGLGNRPDSVASFVSLDEALKFCRQLRSEGKRVREVVGPWGETLGETVSKLVAA